MKSDIYESLHVINAATQQIAEHIERLKADGLLTTHFADIRRLAAEQNCAEINVSITLSLAEREQEDAARIEKERIAQEKRLSSS